MTAAAALPRHVVLAYGALGLPLAFASLPLYVHLPGFYAATTGLSLGLIGALLLAARLADAVIDPLLGWLADRVPRRQLVGWALLPFTAGFVALLHPPTESAALWLAGWLVFTCTGFSAASIAYQAWGADLGHDAAQRTRLVATREACSLGGVLLAAALPGWLAATPVAGTPLLAGWLVAGVVCAAWALFALVPARAGHRDSGDSAPEGGHGSGGPASLRAVTAGLRAALAQPAFARLLAVFALNGVAAALPATLFLFFVADVLGSATAGGPLLALYFAAAAASLPLWVKLAARLGRARAWLLGMGLAMLGFAGTSALGAGDVAAFAAICVVCGLALGADLTLPAALAAELGHAQGRAGACFGWWNLVAKATAALAAGLALPLLAAAGYAPGTAAGHTALQASYALLPLLFKASAAALLWRWRHHWKDVA